MTYNVSSGTLNPTIPILFDFGIINIMDNDYEHQVPIVTIHLDQLTTLMVGMCEKPKIGSGSVLRKPNLRKI